MGRLRKFVCYRRLERPYTRVSKYRKLSYINASPNVLITKFDMGNSNLDYDVELSLVAQENLQIRQNAFEAARRQINRKLSDNLNGIFYFQIKAYPHHILRENPLATGAGADRLSTGMKHSFGKSIGRAAQITKGKALMIIRVNKDKSDFAKGLLKDANHKFPGHYKIEVKNLK